MRATRTRRHRHRLFASLLLEIYEQYVEDLEHFNLTRYHGVFAARVKHRSDVVSGPAQQEAETVQLRLTFGGGPLRATPASEREVDHSIIGWG